MATERQKKAIQRVVENGGNVSKAMRESGYAKKTAKNPKKLTESKTWEELMEQYLPDKLLAKKHKELLTTPKKIRQFQKGELLSEYEELHAEAIKGGLDMAYKLKGHYKPEKHEHRIEELKRLEAYLTNIANDKDTEISSASL